MAKGFEDYTHELSDIELNVFVPQIVKSWNTKEIGEVVKMSVMEKGMNQYASDNNILNKKNKPMKIHGARMRKMIHYIRLNNLVPNLIASQKGYWKSNNKEEILDFIQSCDQRASSFASTAYALRAHFHTNIKTD